MQLYRLCDDLTEPVIYLMALFSPWAFGTTQPWSIWTMNCAGYILGVLLTVKLAIRRLKGYHPTRWGLRETASFKLQTPSFRETPSFVGRSRLRLEACGFSGAWRLELEAWSLPPAILTIAILGYCLVSALNARSTWHPNELSFAYHQYIKWLPHSFDSTKTWVAFWSYLALACSFWALRDWLLGKSSGEQRAEHQPSGPAGSGPACLPVGTAQIIPARLRRLLWLLAVNGALLGLESIAQRLEGSGKLLFMVKPQVNPAGETQFGPYAYRANASQYFNLLWPVCLGFWWTLQRASGFKRKTHHLLLVCGVIMAACPIISTSRGGALVTVGIAGAAAFFLVVSHWFIAARRQEDLPARRMTLALLLLVFVAAISLGYWLGWKQLKPRMAQIVEGFADREEMYERARPMAADFPLFGTGPGTFEPAFQLYRISTETYWPAQLHNDWLETRITFGWAGSALIALAFAAVALRWFVPGGIHGGRRFIILIWLAVAGCLVHARFDFPFQIYSIVFLFLIVCALLSVLSRRATGGRGKSVERRA